MKKIRQLYNNIIEYIVKHTYIDNVLIVGFIFILSLFFSHSCSYIISDRGREFLLPQEILNGQIPYKDITLIYFPFAYYCNALIYKILGVSLNSLIISQSFLCAVAMLIYYKLSRLFLSRGISFLTTIFIIIACVFATRDLFSYIMPYSYARTYGIFATWITVFCAIKLLKTDNIKYAYTASVFAGLAICCKLEFLTIILILVATAFLYKKLNCSKYIISVALFLTFPILQGIVFIIQDITLHEFINAIAFGFKFAKTSVMAEFLANNGLYPYHWIDTVYDFAKDILPIWLIIITFCFISLYKLKKFNNILYIYCTIVLCLVYVNTWFVYKCWVFLPVIITIYFIYHFKSILTSDKSIMLLIFSSIIFAQREFFALFLYSYGTYSLPLLLLSTLVIATKFLPKQILNVKIHNFLIFIMIILITMYSVNLYYTKQYITEPVATKKGCLYTYSVNGYFLQDIINYIENNIDKASSILVLPEGNIINFLTDRKVDLHCYMMDRLYYDAYRDKKAAEMVKNTNSDYIIILRGLDINDFGRPYVYTPGLNLLAKYIEENYKVLKVFYVNEYDSAIILQKGKPNPSIKKEHYKNIKITESHKV